MTNLGASLGTALAGSLMIASLTSAFLINIAAEPRHPGRREVAGQVELAGGVPFVSDADLEAVLDEAGATSAATEAALAANADARTRRPALRSRNPGRARTASRCSWPRPSRPDRSGSTRGRSNDVPLACVFGIADPARGAAPQPRPLADRPEPALQAGRNDDERRRLRRRLVRRRRHPAALPQRPPGVERPEPARARRRDLVAPLPRAHPRVDGNGDPGDQRAPVPLRTLAVDAQRADPRVPAAEARARARDRRLALHLDRGHHRLGDDVLPRPHLRAGERPRRRRRADGRLRRGDRTPARRRASPPDDDRDDRRAAACMRSGTRAKASRDRSTSARAWMR